MQTEIERMKKELESYKEKCAMLEQVEKTHFETIGTYHKIFLLQEAEIQKLKELSERSD